MTTQTTTTITARADRGYIRAHHRSERFVLVELTAPSSTAQRDRPAVNLAFVIDRSGSMAGGKLDLATAAVAAAIKRLEARDRFTVVTYDNEVSVVVENGAATPEGKLAAIERVLAQRPGGSTNLSGGWFTGCEQVAARLEPDAINRTLLLTDGLANVGIKDPAELTRHASELRQRGISTTTFGVGRDFDEALLESMADAGGGHFYFIEGADQIRDHIASEVGEALEITARNVSVEMVHAHGVTVEALSPHPVTERGSRTVVQLGDLVADQVVQVVLRLRFPYGDVGHETGMILSVADGASGSTATATAKLGWTYADDARNDDQPRDVVVDRAVARQFAARARQEAIRANRMGDLHAASVALKSTARRVRSYAGRDAELRAILATLESESVAMAAPMAEMDRKRRHFESSNLARFRSADGTASRRGE